MTTATATLPPPAIRLPQSLAGAVLAVWLPLALLLIWSRLEGVLSLDGLNNDDLTRLLQVRDWLAGQSWWDVSQHRVQQPEGLSMHWTRLGDLGPAALMWLYGLVLNPAGAEFLMIVTWPLLVLLAFMTTIAATARHLGGARAMLPACALIGLSFPLHQQFHPGSLDHHHIQMLCMAVLGLALTRPLGARAGLLAGVTISLAMGIGLEALIYIAAGCLVLGLRWALGHAGGRSALLACGGILIAGALLIDLTLYAGPTWLEPVCDTFARGPFAAMVAGGAAFVLLAAFGERLRAGAQRLGASIAAGIVVSALVLTVAPECTGGPYGGVHPILVKNWIALIWEVRPWLSMAAEAPGVSLGMMGAPFATLGVLIWWLRQQPRLPDPALWGVLALFLAGLAMPFVQFRAIFFANALAAVPAALFIAAYALHRRPLVRVGSLLALSSLPLVLAASPIDRFAEQFKAPPIKPVTPPGPDEWGCRTVDTYRALASLPAGRMALSLDSAPRLLAVTHHNAIGAPYHRAQRANLSMMLVMFGTTTQAMVMLDRLGADYLAQCTDTADFNEALVYFPQGLLAQLDRGTVPPWLTPIPQPAASPLMVFRIDRAGLAAALARVPAAERAAVTEPEQLL